MKSATLFRQKTGLSESSTKATPFFQAKLTVNQPGDSYEQEADTVADRVMRMPDATPQQAMPFSKVSVADLQRKCAACEEEEHVQRKDSGAGGQTAPSSVSNVISGSGHPLDSSTRQFMESRMGQDFSQVQIHTDGQAADSAQAINALAYTSGKHIVFNSGQYRPDTDSGKRLLAHELVHVGQQWGRQNNILRQAAPALVRPPAPMPARPPLRVIQGGMARPPQPGVVAPSSAPSASTYSPPTYLPEPWDNSWDAMALRAQQRQWHDTTQFELEIPRATLVRSSNAPNFVSIDSHQSHQDYAPGGRVLYTARYFHVLDAMEYRISLANSEDDLSAILRDFIPRMLDLRTTALRGPMPFFPPPNMEPLQVLDPDGEIRTRVYAAAVRRRIAQVPRLQTATRFVPEAEETNMRGCRVTPARSLGNDPLASLYCQLATGSMFESKVISPMGSAVFDGRRGNVFYECKCGYNSVVRGQAENRWWARRSMDSLDEQMLRHQRILASCGFSYTYIVSNNEFADFLRRRSGWENIHVEVRTVDGLCN